MAGRCGRHIVAISPPPARAVRTLEEALHLTSRGARFGGGQRRSVLIPFGGVQSMRLSARSKSRLDVASQSASSLKRACVSHIGEFLPQGRRSASECLMEGQP
jgi:hypothetical protein